VRSKDKAVVQVRGKTVYLQYSTRQEIVNATSAMEDPSNVILATLENLQPDTVITIEQLWSIFAAFGNVQKIATFEKSAGFQALVQYETPELAKAAKDQLDGRSIPRSILPSRTQCQLRIAFSGHRDLNVKYQSHRGRDFTNPDLPWLEVDPEIAARGIQAPMSHTPENGNVLLVQVRVHPSVCPSLTHIQSSVQSMRKPLSQRAIPQVSNQQDRCRQSIPKDCSELF
jgi:hypothetical protein